MRVYLIEISEFIYEDYGDCCRRCGAPYLSCDLSKEISAIYASMQQAVDQVNSIFGKEVCWCNGHDDDYKESCHGTGKELYQNGQEVEVRISAYELGEAFEDRIRRLEEKDLLKAD